MESRNGLITVIHFHGSVPERTQDVFERKRRRACEAICVACTVRRLFINPWKNMKKIYTLGTLILFTFILIPQIVFAAWWNPFTWNIFRFWKTEKTVVQEVQIEKIPDFVEPSEESDLNTNNEVQKDVKHIDTSKNTLNTQEEKRTDDPRSALISNFLKNPTLENFKTFCISAKNTEGSSTKQVLNDNRENIVDIKLSLYEEIEPCHPSDRNILLPLDSNLLVAFKDNDSNEIREGKILFNEQIKGLMNTSKVKFISFRIEVIDGKQAKNPRELFEFYAEAIKKAENLLSEANKNEDTISFDITSQNLLIMKQKIKGLSDVNRLDVSKYFR